MPVEEQVVSIFAGVRGYLDKLAVGDITRFEQALLGEMRAKHKTILDTIRAEQSISPDTETKLKSLMDNFTRIFA
jgi:F-type H+-transporting ATPase subunit alpha